jgi:hypothetical protein
MKTCLALAAVIFCWIAAPAWGHRLDEYLQATTISLAKDEISLRIRLTPGVAVAEKILADIGADGSGIISDAHQRAYAEQVQRDLQCSIDDHPATLRLASYAFPSVDDIKSGLGDIVLDFRANLPTGSLQRKLTFENHHQTKIAVYLVNCLVPRDSSIKVIAQNRNYDQSSYQLDFVTAGNAARPEPRSDQAINAGVFETFFVQGVRHILTGYDRLLFIGALVLAAGTLWDLVKIVTGFTLAHSITLTLAAFNLVHLPAQVVEPLISASIIFVAVQNIFWPGKSHGPTRVAVAFFFGLFHGLGFAGGLLDLMHQMPTATVLLALLGFSVGVEAGHQMVLLPLLSVPRAHR